MIQMCAYLEVMTTNMLEREEEEEEEERINQAELH